MLKARQVEADEHRRRLEADDSKQRALKDMMNSKLEFRKKNEAVEEVLVSVCRGEMCGLSRLLQSTLTAGTPMFACVPSI